MSVAAGRRLAVGLGRRIRRRQLREATAALFTYEIAHRGMKITDNLNQLFSLARPAREDGRRHVAAQFIGNAHKFSDSLAGDAARAPHSLSCTEDGQHIRRMLPGCYKSVDSRRDNRMIMTRQSFARNFARGPRASSSMICAKLPVGGNEMKSPVVITM